MSLQDIEFTLLDAKLIIKLDDITKRYYSMSIKSGMAEYMNKLRKKASTYIIDDTTGLPNFRTGEDWKYRRMKYFYQKTHPVKTTSRSGRLKAGMLEGGMSPFKDLDKFKTETSHSIFKSLNGIIEGGGPNIGQSNTEVFKGRWNPYVRDGSVMLQNYQDIIRGNISLAEAKKLLAIRFQHENGLKGSPKMFFFPAHMSMRNELTPLIMKSLRINYVNRLR